MVGRTGERWTGKRNIFRNHRAEIRVLNSFVGACPAAVSEVTPSLSRNRKNFFVSKHLCPCLKVKGNPVVFSALFGTPYPGVRCLNASNMSQANLPKTEIRVTGSVFFGDSEKSGTGREEQVRACVLAGRAAKLRR